MDFYNYSKFLEMALASTTLDVSYEIAVKEPAIANSFIFSS